MNLEKSKETQRVCGGHWKSVVICGYDKFGVLTNAVMNRETSKNQNDAQ